MTGLTTGSGIVAVVLLTMLALPAGAAQPSFDCDGAKSEVEKMICGDDALADLDLRLARDFARVLSRASADQVPELRASQREWRAQMLKCARTGDPRGCVLEAYTKRIAQF
ncbi:lysozyme inhibitor LprI family protein [Pleomorphomonas sp. JP5]|uniref:lysozyme inhibitor LprI family protein n=1 Tax=Pleomorphomonas sp. JP5 TaxID=2942998 RepID=UPI0020440301|nr:lysozyme inhibitor LprI family protein [Pleomorphomonas sp. JP5]MCM5559116.1 lysozyme inhibitor LprI family protein [Pleomorphomonas sp. JP5]